MAPTIISVPIVDGAGTGRGLIPRAAGWRPARAVDGRHSASTDARPTAPHRDRIGNSVTSEARTERTPLAKLRIRTSVSQRRRGCAFTRHAARHRSGHRAADRSRQSVSSSPPSSSRLPPASVSPSVQPLDRSVRADAIDSADDVRDLGGREATDVRGFLRSPIRVVVDGLEGGPQLVGVADARDRSGVLICELDAFPASASTLHGLDRDDLLRSMPGGVLR